MDLKQLRQDCGDEFVSEGEKRVTSSSSSSSSSSSCRARQGVVMGMCMCMCVGIDMGGRMG